MSYQGNSGGGYGQWRQGQAPPPPPPRHGHPPPPQQGPPQQQQGPPQQGPPQQGAPQQGWNQPPAGWGPQQPGGWGHQQPPGQPPGQPPVQPPPQPPGWGQQGHPGGPHGYPQHQQPPRKSRKGLIIGLVGGGGGLALLVVAVLVIVSLVSGGDDSSGEDQKKAAPPDRKVAWTIPEATSDAEATLHTAYVVDQLFVRASEAGIVGYDLNTGKEKWRVEPPSGFTTVCSASPEHTNNKIGVVFGTEDGCGKVQVVDLTTGKPILQNKAEPSSDLSSGAAIAAADGKFFAPFPNGSGVVAYDETKDVWQTPLEGQLADCAVNDIAADTSRVLAVVNCALDQKLYLVSLDPATGKPAWQTQILTKNVVGGANIVSVTPMVLYAGDASGGTMQVLDDTGKAKFSITRKGQGGTLAFLPTGGSVDNAHAYFPVKVTPDTLIALTNTRESTGGKGTKVVGVDLANGKRKWVADPLASDCRFARSTDPKKAMFVGYPLEFAKDPPKIPHARLGTVNPANGKVTTGDTFAEPKGGHPSSTTNMRFIAAGKRLLQLAVDGSAQGPAVVAYGGA